MTHVLKVGYGSALYTLTSSPYYMEEFTPIPSDGEKNVTESATVYVVETTIASLLTRLSELKRTMERGRERQRTQTGDKAYVYFQPDGDTDNWRSEIVDGRVVYDENAFKYWANKGVRVTLIWTRRYYWESATLTQLALDYGVGATTSPVVVYNHDDAGNVGNVKFWAVEGDLPTPVKVILRVNDAGIAPQRFYLGMVDVPSTTYPTDVYEGEDSDGAGTPTVAAAASDGNYMARSWTGAITHSTDLYYWTIPSATLALGDNRWFSVLVRCHTSPPADTYARLSLQYPAGTPSVALWTGPETLLDTARKLQYLGSIPLPPGPEVGTPVDLSLVLSVRSPVTSALNVDYLHLFGPEFQRFDQFGGALALDDLIISDGPEDAVYLTDGGGGGDLYAYHNRGNALMAYPGRYHVFRMLMDDQTGDADITYSFDLTMWYRKRKITP